jgi:glutamate/tyrosine decarboxylase-like PLP-dependent enzyme
MTSPAAPDPLELAQAHARAYLAGVAARPVVPTAEALAGLAHFDRELQVESCAAEEVLSELDRWGSPATVATQGGRYFGFVTGGSLPVATGANWLATAWDQNAALRVLSPAAVKLEDVALGWIVSLLGLPVGTGGAFVTAATAANMTALAAARQALLQRQGWDCNRQGLFGAPPLRVVVSAEIHSTVLKGLSLLGLGSERVERVPVDDQGLIRPELLPPLDATTIVVVQAGNVNSGACDPIAAVCERARAAGAWVHVDGAFGLWAAACAEKRALVRGIEMADSWGVDCHKWLNTPYDCGVALVREAALLRAAMAIQAPYLPTSAAREPSHFGPELSRRARGVEVWAALRHLGRGGVDALVARTCRHARTFAGGLRSAGHEVLNEVVLNQVVVAFGSDERTREVIRRIQESGVLWCGGSLWQGRAVMRISVSSWATTDADVDLSLRTIIALARAP